MEVYAEAQFAAGTQPAALAPCPSLIVTNKSAPHPTPTRRAGFFLVVCLINLCGWLVVRRRSGELPGVLCAPRMQLVALMLVLPPLAEAGAGLLK